MSAGHDAVRADMTKLERLLITVRNLINAENKHARLAAGQVDPVNTSRDDADFWHAEVVGFTAAEVTGMLSSVRRRADRLTPAPEGAQAIPDRFEEEGVTWTPEGQKERGDKIYAALQEERQRSSELRMKLREAEASPSALTAHLAEALSPFVFGSAVMEQILWGRFPDQASGTISATLGDFRRAREVLAAYQATPPAPAAQLAAAEAPDAQLVAMLTRDHKRMREAGTSLAEAALRVIREYDGTHRLGLAVAGWAKAVADEGDRACTCHPDDNPPVPCAKRYAYSECVAATRPTDQPAAHAVAGDAAQASGGGAPAVAGVTDAQRAAAFQAILCRVALKLRRYPHPHPNVAKLEPQVSDVLKRYGQFNVFRDTPTDQGVGTGEGEGA